MFWQHQSQLDMSHRIALCFAVDSNVQAQLTKLTTVIVDVLNVQCLYQKDLCRINSFGSLFCIHVYSKVF